MAVVTNPGVEALAKLREPFPPHQISKLPKETKRQADERKKEQDAGRWPAKCGVCGGVHHPRAVHLDYVGHAALTDRLLDVDPAWSWEPMSCGPDGLPALDRNGGLWIKLTVCGVSRLGYGSADGKSGGDAIKEIIGDALRNAAMRFGAALDLWHKGDLHVTEGDDSKPEADDKPAAKPAVKAAPAAPLDDRVDAVTTHLLQAPDRIALEKVWAKASALCADLSTADPDKLEALTKLYDDRRAEFIGGTPFDNEQKAA